MTEQILAAFRADITRFSVSAEHLRRLILIQTGVTVTIIILMVTVIVLNLRILRLQRKMRTLLKELTETQEKRLQIAMERIGILENVLGLRREVPDDPTPPQVLM